MIPFVLDYFYTAYQLGLTPWRLMLFVFCLFLQRMALRGCARSGRYPPVLGRIWLRPGTWLWTSLVPVGRRWISGVCHCPLPNYTLLRALVQSKECWLTKCSGTQLSTAELCISMSYPAVLPGLCSKEHHTPARKRANSPSAFDDSSIQNERHQGETCGRQAAWGITRSTRDWLDNSSLPSPPATTTGPSPPFLTRLSQLPRLHDPSLRLSLLELLPAMRSASHGNCRIFSARRGSCQDPGVLGWKATEPELLSVLTGAKREILERTGDSSIELPRGGNVDPTVDPWEVSAPPSPYRVNRCEQWGAKKYESHCPYSCVRLCQCCALYYGD
jgi:hypothetical protein